MNIDTLFVIISIPFAVVVFGTLALVLYGSTRLVVEALWYKYAHIGAIICIALMILVTLWLDSRY